MTVHFLDTRGQRCPQPIINLAKFVLTIDENDSVEIVSSDPAAEFDIPAWARLKGRACSAPRSSRDGISPPSSNSFEVWFTVGPR